MTLLFVSNLVFLIVGYMLGKQTTPKEIVRNINETVNQTKRIFHDTPTGVIKKKTREDIERLNMPQAKKEELQAIKETLDGIPDLREAKEKYDQYKRAGRL